MFDNIGGKIKGLAKFFCWVGIIISVIAGIIMISTGVSLNDSYYSRGSGTSFIWSGLLVIVVGSLLSWLGSLTLYGFGELVEKSTECADELKKQNRMMDDIKNGMGNIDVKQPEGGPEGGKTPNPLVKSEPKVGTKVDKYGWKLSTDEKYVFCPKCDNYFSVDYMKYHSYCTNCRNVRELQNLEEDQ